MYEIDLDHQTRGALQDFFRSLAMWLLWGPGTHIDEIDLDHPPSFFPLFGYVSAMGPRALIDEIHLGHRRPAMFRLFGDVGSRGGPKNPQL